MFKLVLAVVVLSAFNTFGNEQMISICGMPWDSNDRKMDAIEKILTTAIQENADNNFQSAIVEDLKLLKGHGFSAIGASDSLTEHWLAPGRYEVRRFSFKVQSERDSRHFEGRITADTRSKGSESLVVVFTKVDDDRVPLTRPLSSYDERAKAYNAVASVFGDNLIAFACTSKRVR